MTVLDFSQLESVTMGDAELVREIVGALITDTAEQLTRLELALEEGDSGECARVAHSAKGACANVGAEQLATLLLAVERSAKQGDLPACSAALPALATALAELRDQAVTL